MNPYLYCRAGPVTLSDPTGLDPTIQERIDSVDLILATYNLQMMAAVDSHDLEAIEKIQGGIDFFTSIRGGLAAERDWVPGKMAVEGVPDDKHGGLGVITGLMNQKSKDAAAKKADDKHVTAAILYALPGGEEAAANVESQANRLDQIHDEIPGPQSAEQLFGAGLSLASGLHSDAAGAKRASRGVGNSNTAATRGPTSGVAVVSPPKPGQVRGTPGSNPGNTTAFEGHGLQVRGKYDIVPEGTSVEFSVDANPGYAAWHAGEFGEFPPGEATIIVGPGGKIPRLILQPKQNLIVADESITVTNGTYLKDMLQPNMGHCLWGACRKPVDDD